MAAIENRGPTLQAVAVSLLVAAIISILLRCYVRIFLIKNFGVDDYFMGVAMVFFALFVTFVLVGIKYGTGRHHWDLETADEQKAMRAWWFCYLWYCLSMIASKISIGYFLLRITVRKLDIWIIYSVMGVTLLTGAVFFFVTLFQCNPVSFFWDKSPANGTCVDIEVIIALTYLYSACSVICDFTFAILPVFLIMSLSMDRKTRLALVPIVMMACVASSAVVVRFAFVKDFKNPDFLYATVDIAIWSTTESGLAIIAGSLATLRPLFRLVARAMGLSTNDPSGYQVSGQQRIPSGMGWANQADEGRDSRRGKGPFSLTTFLNDEAEARTGGASEESEDAQRKRSLDRKRGSIWKSKGGDAGDSEEELTFDGSKKTTTWTTPPVGRVNRWKLEKLRTASRILAITKLSPPRPMPLSFFPLRVFTRKMSTISLANLQRISAKDLSEILLTQQAAATDPTVAVVDVRDDVVFHCALSQQRGPSAALKYLRERDQMMRRENPAELANQTVYVLDLGFSGWQQTYGEDERLTDGYSKELWQSGF
ncbi:hypothetical protein BN1723_004857 [Verticillium longisporum]|uniref:Rhodanese domain-containing protein n=1 Tax=Verticillium longisporum TaxID=100787 RepID=A0A0G4N2B8_VERLO|nr:hypothetical protein BN1723_004857 [Verticillium longisporum]